VGLDDARQIPSIAVDFHDANRIDAAVLGLSDRARSALQLHLEPAEKA
jgi:hypothetical protein